jgi:hypothetical protein
MDSGFIIYERALILTSLYKTNYNEFLSIEEFKN